MSNIGELIKAISGDAPVIFRVGTVTAVDKDKDICTVQPVNGEAERLDVLLKAIQDEADNGYILYPAKDSMVLVGIIDNVVTHSFIALLTQVESIKQVIDSNKITADKDLYKVAWKKWQHNDGKYGGLIKLKDPNNVDAGILARVNKIEQTMNTLLSTLMGVTIPTPTGSFPFNTVISPIQPLVLTQASDLEDQNVTH